jgi:hypothetical protein
VDESMYAIWIPGTQAKDQVSLDLAQLCADDQRSNWKIKSLYSKNKTSVRNGIVNVEMSINPLQTPQVFKIDF